uniref:Putative reverse transcriptase-rnase h-integrase n=1 Tax=Moniliophthora roreri TaxID=221103 RepID=A0A0W0F5G6_MONRR
MGFEPNQPPSEAESVNQFKQQMQAGLEEAKAALDKAEQEYTQYYNRCHVPALEFKPGDKVWLDASDIQTDQPSKKLANCNLMFTVVKLTAHTPDPIPGCAPKPPPAPVVIEGEKYYKIETIIDPKYRLQSLLYLCMFDGYRALE